MDTPVQPRSYIIYLRHFAPLRVVTSVDLLQSYREQLEARAFGRISWGVPIVFEDDTGEAVAAFAPGDVLGIVQGAEEAPGPLSRKLDNG